MLHLEESKASCSEMNAVWLLDQNETKQGIWTLVLNLMLTNWAGEEAHLFLGR